MQNAWVPFKVTNFGATIIADRVLDDGAEESRWFTVRAVISGCATTIEIGAKDFRCMNWVTERLGGMAIIYPGQAEHARTAIQCLSGKIPMIRAFSHTGWRKIGGEPHYLHAGGAIGTNGNRTDVHVNLEGTLSNYCLPVPPSGADRTRAICSSLAVLDIAPDRITFPALAAVYRAILGTATFSIHIEGPSGEGKSELASLIQQHFGPEMDAHHLPATWGDTALANVTLAFFAKDAVLVVDDFVLSGNIATQQKLHSDADRLFRSQANAAGRRRLTTEGKLRSSHPPRGLIISTGEHTPRGKSLNARMVMLPFPQGAMNWARLTECQIAAARGDLAMATAAFIQWIAGRLSTVRSRMADICWESRKSATGIGSPHKRTPENLTSLSFGLKLFLEFAQESNAISHVESLAYIQRSELAFAEVAQNEFGKHSANDPARIFVRLLRAAILMGRAHLASPSGGPPDDEAPWGWQRPSEMPDGQRIPQGACIGWLKGTDVCLDPEASFQIAVRFAHERGDSLPGTLESLKRDLKGAGLIRTDEKRRTFTVRRTFQGQAVDVLCFALKTFQAAALEYADNADNADNHFWQVLSEVDS